MTGIMLEEVGLFLKLQNLKLDGPNFAYPRSTSCMVYLPTPTVKNSQRFQQPVPIASMGLVYLPTFG